MFSICSELTPRAPIPDSRITQFMHCIICSPVKWYFISQKVLIILGFLISKVTFGRAHCPMGVSTRPAWHSEFYAWLFLLWPRLIQNSCWINLKGGAFWENLSSVVTSLDSWKTNWEIKKELFYWLSEVLMWILWPQLKYWFQSRHF